MDSPLNPDREPAWRFSVAPMLDCTDRHFRMLMRQISKQSLLYSEMVVAQALHHSKRRERLLDFDAEEHPLALQVGGDDPALLADATRMAADWGYDEINLNVGCPSPRVQAGNFGACLMAEPQTVARCVEAMVAASSLPVTVKHRVGIDDLDSDDLLRQFVDQVAEAGALRFSVHARKAWLEGLDPKQNRTIPALQHDRVIALKASRPDLTIELNGGLDTPEDCLNALKHLRWGHGRTGRLCPPTALAQHRQPDLRRSATPSAGFWCRAWANPPCRSSSPARRTTLGSMPASGPHCGSSARSTALAQQPQHQSSKSWCWD